ncbi:MAG: YdeI/OmpD-associated family protein [Acidobacteriaceae bacterium]|nr:YdeI/OmpD-associated family protein [Acidobacteriaceae bacterium]
MKPKFFATAAAWREWLEKYHDQKEELLVGFHKRGSGQPSITWPESVDQALCFGWIDGVRRTIDENSYTIRFTPRKTQSTWSAVNIRRVEELTRQGLMHPAGSEAFERRTANRSAIYAFEQRERPEFTEEQLKRFQANRVAWNFFEAKPPWYRRTATWWVVSAKRPDTREKRLSTLIEDSEHGRTIRPLTRK